MTTKSWTIVIVTLTLLVCGCSHADRAVRATSAAPGVGLTTPASDLSPAVEVPGVHDVLTAPGEFPLPTETDRKSVV